MGTSSPTAKPVMTTFAPTILTNQDITTISPTLPPATTQNPSPTISPTIFPTAFPTMSPTKSPTLPPMSSSTSPPSTSPTPSPTVAPKLSFTAVSISPSVSPTVSSAAPFALSAPTPTTPPTADATEVDTSKCSFHPKCYAANLAGNCCPTADGTMLGCCGDFWDKKETDESESRSSAQQVFRFYQILVISAMSVLLGCW